MPRFSVNPAHPEGAPARLWRGAWHLGALLLLGLPPVALADVWQARRATDMRSGADGVSRVITRLPAGSMVEGLPGRFGPWAQVRTADGLTGWVLRLDMRQSADAADPAAANYGALPAAAAAPLFAAPRAPTSIATPGGAALGDMTLVNPVPASPRSIAAGPATLNPAPLLAPPLPATLRPLPAATVAVDVSPTPEATRAWVNTPVPTPVAVTAPVVATAPLPATAPAPQPVVYAAPITLPVAAAVPTAVPATLPATFPTAAPTVALAPAAAPAPVAPATAMAAPILAAPLAAPASTATSPTVALMAPMPGTLARPPVPVVAAANPVTAATPASVAGFNVPAALPASAAGMAPVLQMEALAQESEPARKLYFENGFDLVKLPAGSARRGAPLEGLAALPLASEQQIGRQFAANQLNGKALSGDAQLQRYVNLLGRWLSLESARPNLAWTFAVLDDTRFDAGSAPGGYVWVTRGLVERVASEAELAAVLAREISLVAAGSHLRGGSAAAPRDSDLLDADVAATELLARTGFDPGALQALLERMTRASVWNRSSFNPMRGERPDLRQRLSNLYVTLDERLLPMGRGKAVVTVEQRLRALAGAPVLAPTATTPGTSPVATSSGTRAAAGG